MAIFETMRVRGGAIPFLDRHMLRFMKNQKALALAELPTECADRLLALASAGPAEHVVRVQWDGSSLEITTRDLPHLDGMDVIVSSVVHPGYSIKTTDRAHFDQAREEAASRGADESLLLTSEGFVAEGTIFAIGWFANDVLCLPALDLEILPSIGRARVVECATALGITVREGRFSLREMVGNASLATTSVRGVVPIITLDGIPVPTHESVQRLSQMFWP